MASPPPPIHIDGTTLEGGGQLVRLALSLSALIKKPIHITSIRGNRSRDGGLKGSHLAAVEFLARACGAHTEGMQPKSKDLLFEQCRDENERLMHGNAQWWKSIKNKEGTTVGRAIEIKQATPGSIFLVFQALLPYLLFSSSFHSSTITNPNDNPNHPLPITLTIHGGTNVPASPSLEYTHQVLLPTLSRLGLPPITLTSPQRGWTHGRPQLGRATFTLTPLAPGTHLPPFRPPARTPASDPIAAIHASVLAPDATTRAQIRKAVSAAVRAARWASADVEVDFPVDEDSGHAKRVYLLLVAETGDGWLFGRDWLFDRKVGEGGAGGVVGVLVDRVVRDLGWEVERRGWGAVVDGFMEDQLVVFMALAGGRSRVCGCEDGDGGGGGGEDGDGEDEKGEEVERRKGGGGKRGPTLHTRTAQWVASTILGVTFDERDGGCEGVGLVAGGELAQTGSERALVDEMDTLRIQ